MIRTNKVIILVAIISFILIIIGCTKVHTPSDKVLSIVQGNLFDGELKRVGPHLQFLDTTSVSIDYKGDKKKLSCRYEIWNDGELIEKKRYLYKNSS